MTPTKDETKSEKKKRHADESRRRHMGLMIVYRRGDE